MPLKKSLISLRLDPEVLAWYRSQGGGYQLVIQDVLKRHMTRTLNPMPGDLSMSPVIRPPSMGENPNPCPKCKGIGTIKKKQGKLVVQISCPACEGTTFGPEDPGRGGTGLEESSDGLLQQCALDSPDDRFVAVKDARQGTIRLEHLRQPLYDTQVHGTMFDVPMNRREEYQKNAPSIAFFQNPGGPGRGEAFTNVATSGQLSWPKRFNIDGIRVSFSHLVDISQASLALQIGEKRYLTLPLKNMERDDDPIKDGEYGPLLPRMRLKHVGISPTIYIPPVQWFGVTIDTGGKHFESAEIRVQLDGMLYREIQ